MFSHIVVVLVVDLLSSVSRDFEEVSSQRRPLVEVVLTINSRLSSLLLNPKLVVAASHLANRLSISRTITRCS